MTAYLGNNSLKQELHDAALDLMHRGMSVVACDGKIPLGGKNWHQQVVDEALLAQLLNSAMNPAIGVKLGPESGIIDIEIDNAEEEALFAALFTDCEIPPTPTYQSPRGTHRFFKFDERLEGTGAGVINYRDGGDAKLGCRIGAAGKAAQSVVPPSPGRAWLPGLSLADRDPAPLPDVVLQRLLASVKLPHQAGSDRGRRAHSDNGGVNLACLKAMKRAAKSMSDGADGSRRLFTSCCRAVEYDLSDVEAVATIAAYAADQPFPRTWSDDEILQRVRDAECATTRGKALVVKRALTDVGNSERFAAQHGDDVHYSFAWKSWLVWTGRRWKLDDDGAVYRLAKSVAKGIFDEAKMADDRDEQKSICAWAHVSQSRARLEAMLALAQSEQPIPIDHHSLDANPWLLNCENGTVDLRTGRLQPHARGDLLTKTTGVEYLEGRGGDCDRWRSFLNEIFGGNTELIAFIQRLVGCALVGEVYEHILPIFYGTGSNGKGVFVETIMAALGEYALKAPQTLLIASKHSPHPTEMADLFGVRFVAAVETESGARLAEAKVKELTGGDTIAARRMQENFWRFEPSHTLVLVTNHKPSVYGSDHGIWRRLRLVPFTVTIPPERQDKTLSRRLLDERPGILRWAVAGCLEWQRRGHALGEPREVLCATAGYRTENDTFAQWLEDRCVQTPDVECKSSLAYGSYCMWCEAANERPINHRQFGERVADSGFERLPRRRDGIYYRGFGLLPATGERCE